MRPNIPTCVLIACCLFPPTLPSATAAPVRASTIEGKNIEGAWLGIQDAKIKLSVEGKDTLIDPAELMSLHWMGTTSRPAAAASRPSDEITVHLADGSRFPARILGSQGETIRLQTSLVPQLDLPMSRIAGLRYSHLESTAAVEAYTEALTNRDPTQDTLIVAQDGKVNTLRGVLEKLTESGGTFKWRERSVPIDRTRIFGLVLAKGAGAPAAPQARCILENGSVWAGRLTGGDEQKLELELAAGPTIDIAIDLINDIRFRNEHFVFLSDLEPASYEFTPWGVTRWEYRKDRSVANRPLQIGGQVFDRGIGMHSRSALTYTLNEPFQHLAASIGIDDAVGSRGNVVFRVIADGRELFNSGPVSGSDDPKPLLVSLGGAKTLQLVVDFGEDLDVGDHADWGNARLLK